MEGCATMKRQRSLHNASLPPRRISRRGR